VIRFIAFDLGNLLFRVDHGPAWQQTRAHTLLGEEELFRRFYGSGDMIECLMGSLDDHVFFGRLAQELEYTGGVDQLIGIWQGVFAPIPERLALLAELERDYEIGVISNISRFQSDHLERQFPWLQQYRSVTYSWRCGYLKPRPEIFVRSLECSGHEPGQCLFIDDQQRHVEAAEALGWHGLHVALEDDLRASLRQALQQNSIA